MVNKKHPKGPRQWKNTAFSVTCPPTCMDNPTHGDHFLSENIRQAVIKFNTRLIPIRQRSNYQAQSFSKLLLLAERFEKAYSWWPTFRLVSNYFEDGALLNSKLLQDSLDGSSIFRYNLNWSLRRTRSKLQCLILFAFIFIFSVYYTLDQVNDRFPVPSILKKRILPPLTSI